MTQNYRKIIAYLFPILMLLGTITIVIPDNVSATLPTITNYGSTPSYGDVGDTIFHFWMRYTDIDNQAPSTGYPKAAKMSTTFPNFAFVANDTGDTNYADGKLYYKDYYYFPVIGVTFWSFKVKSGTDAEVMISWACTTTTILPSTPEPYNIYPQSNQPGEFIITFNYTSKWALTPFHVNVTMDDVSYSMIENNSGDTNYADGKDYYFNINLTVGIHNYSFQWHETSYNNIERTTGEHWLLLEESTDYNYLFVLFLISGFLMCMIIIAYLGSTKR